MKGPIDRSSKGMVIESCTIVQVRIKTVSKMWSAYDMASLVESTMGGRFTYPYPKNRRTPLIKNGQSICPPVYTHNFAEEYHADRRKWRLLCHAVAADPSTNSLRIRTVGILLSSGQAVFFFFFCVCCSPTGI